MTNSELLFNCWLRLERIRKQTKDELKRTDSAFAKGKLEGICLAMQTFGATVENAKAE